MTVRFDGDDAFVDVLVQPRASRARVGPMHDGRLRVAVTAPPVDGKANAAVVKALAAELGIPARDVAVVRGQSSRRKTVRIRGADRSALTELVQP